MAHRLLLALALIALLAPSADAGQPQKHAARCELRGERAAKQLFGRLLRCLRLQEAGKGNDCEAVARSRLRRRLQRLGEHCHEMCMADRLRVAADTTLAEVRTSGESTCQRPERLVMSPLGGPTAAECGGPGFGRPATPPFSGEVGDAVGDTLADLMLGCVYTGDGVRGANAIYPYNVDGRTTLTIRRQGDSDVVQLMPIGEPGLFGCSQGSGPGAHCLGSGVACSATSCKAAAGLPCTSDADCGGAPGACQGDPNCFATAPVQLNVFGSPVCLVNVVRADESGSLDIATGDIEAHLPITTRIHGAACPRCEGGSCTAGERASRACTPSDPGPTSVDCLPAAESFIGAIDLEQTATTGVRTEDATGGRFCPTQVYLGAFGLQGARRISQRGAPAGDLRDFEPHEATTVIIDCIPATGDPGIDYGGGLPFPLAVARRVRLQLQQ